MKTLKVCYIGSYNPDYPRNRILLKGLQLNDVDIVECHISEHVHLWKRNFGLFQRYLSIPHDFDAILVAETNQVIVPLAKLLSLLTRKPLIFDIFFSLYDSYVNDRQTVEARSLKARCFYGLDKMSLIFPDRIIADTRQHLEFYHHRFRIPQENIHVIYVGCDPELFFPMEDFARDRPTPSFTVTFMGTFIPLHGIEYIIRAARLLESERDIRFEIIGSGQTYKEIRSLSEQLALCNCSFFNPVPLQELPKLLARGDVCLGIFGHTEKAQRVIPNKVYQQLAMRKPVITGESPAIQEVFRHAEHLLLCQMADEQSLAEAILRLKHDELLRTRIAENGYRLVTEHFTPKVIGRHVKELIEALL